MFSDVLVALGRCRAIDRVIVVTDDRRAQQLAAGYGATVSEDGQPSHSAAAARGLELAASDGAERALLVPGDCPLLDPGELDGPRGAAARAAGRLRASAGVALIVPDRHGSGTNALAFDLPAPIAPAFGPGSRERHAAAAAAAGALYELASIPTLGARRRHPGGPRARSKRRSPSATAAPRTRGACSLSSPAAPTAGDHPHAASGAARDQRR